MPVRPAVFTYPTAWPLGCSALLTLSAQGELLIISLGLMGSFSLFQAIPRGEGENYISKGAFIGQKKKSICFCFFLILKVTCECLSETLHHSLAILRLQV